jgi:predicted nucleic acid-binding protein
MLVIADTSPLNYLVLIDAVELLPRLYGQVILPQAAWEELKHPGAPATVSAWVASLPSWVEVRQPPPETGSYPELNVLGNGEREALLIAELYRDHATILLLLDEGLARQHAAARHLAATGTLGVLKSAAAHGWIDLADFFARLRQTNFRGSDKLLQQLLDEDAQRKKLAADVEGQ